MKQIINKNSTFKLSTRILLAGLAAWAVALVLLCIYNYAGIISGKNANHVFYEQENATAQPTGTLVGGKVIALSPFDKIHTMVALRVKWQANENSACVANIDTDDITVVVESDTLIIRSTDSSWFSKKQYDHLTISCSSPMLSEAIISGSGKISAKKIQTDRFTATVNGSGNINLDGVAQTIYGNIQGSGKLMLGNLNVNTANIVINGAGYAKIIRAKNAQITINGSGKIRIGKNTNITKQTINGSGIIKIGD